MKTGKIYHDHSFNGTIGFTNLAMIMFASTVPLTLTFRRFMFVPKLIVMYVCQSFVSLGSLMVSVGIYLFNKSKIYIAIILIFVLMAGVAGFIKYQTDVRIDLWTLIAKKSIEHPVIGIGFGRFKDLNIILRGDGEDRDSQAARAHNTFLQVFTEGGAICLIPLLLFVLSTFIDFVRSEKTPEQKMVFGCLAGFYFAMLFDFPDKSMAVMMLITILLVAHQNLIREDL